MKLLWKHIPGPGRIRVPWAAGPTGDLGPECRELKAGLTSEACGAGSPEASLPPRSSGQAFTQAGPTPPPSAALFGRSSRPLLPVPQPPGLRCLSALIFFSSFQLESVTVGRVIAVFAATIY